MVLVTVATVVTVQIKADGALTSKCSYLDPITIDLLAFVAAAFLFIEGIYRIVEHINAPLKKQVSRSVRIAFGAAIMTLHLMQFMHK